MVDNENNVSVEGLREEIRSPVKTVAQKLTADLASNLESITVVGSALTDDFLPGKSDINLVLVLGKRDLKGLNRLAEAARSLAKLKVATPVIMTAEYIERSRDVFAIEFLDFQLTHRTILGADPFAGLQFEKSHVRLQCERELKATLVRLRQSYIASGAKPAVMRDVLISTIAGLIPLLRAMLWLYDTERPARAEETLVKAAGKFEVKPDVLIEVLGWRRRRGRLESSHMQANFEMVYAIVDKLARIVDEIEVS
ncbi:MAG: hypothetical protein ABII09_00805 [Planctomycetota bacterium]